MLVTTPTPYMLGKNYMLYMNIEIKYFVTNQGNYAI